MAVVHSVEIREVTGKTETLYHLNGRYTATGEGEYHHEGASTCIIRRVIQNWIVFDKETQLMRSECANKRLTDPANVWKVYNSKHSRWATQKVSVQSVQSNTARKQPRNEQFDFKDEHDTEQQSDQKRQKSGPLTCSDDSRTSAAATVSYLGDALDKKGLPALAKKVAEAACNVAVYAKNKMYGEATAYSGDPGLSEGDSSDRISRGKSLQHHNKHDTAPPAPSTRDCETQDTVQDLKQRVEDLLQENATLVQKMRVDSDKTQDLTQQVADLRQANGKLLQERRAERSGAGNNKINSDFPFTQENKVFYAKIIDSAKDLLGPCLDAQDIPWACAASKHIFKMCCTYTQKYTLGPQQDFKTQMLIGEGAEDESEWENTRFSMVKLQRVIRSKVLSHLKNEMQSADENFNTSCQETALAKLLSHPAYTKNALETFVNKLTKVSFPPEYMPTRDEMKNEKMILCLVFIGSDGDRPR